MNQDELAQLTREVAEAQPVWKQQGLLSGASTVYEAEGATQFPVASTIYEESTNNAQPIHLDEPPQKGGGGGAPEFIHPFRCLIRQNPNTGVLERKTAIGTLYRDIGGVDTYQTIIGLDFWTPLIAAEIVWLRVTINPTGEVVAANIGSSDSGWDGYPAPASYDSEEKQDYSFKQLYRIEVSGANFIIHQNVYTNLVMVSRCFDFKPLLYAVPY